MQSISLPVYLNKTFVWIKLSRSLFVKRFSFSFFLFVGELFIFLNDCLYNLYLFDFISILFYVFYYFNIEIKYFQENTCSVWNIYFTIHKVKKNNFFIWHWWVVNYQKSYFRLWVLETNIVIVHILYIDALSWTAKKYQY